MTALPTLQGPSVIESADESPVSRLRKDSAAAILSVSDESFLIPGTRKCLTTAQPLSGSTPAFRGTVEPILIPSEGPALGSRSTPELQGREVRARGFSGHRPRS
jgi:hypothetical protein